MSRVLGVLCCLVVTASMCGVARADLLDAARLTISAPGVDQPKVAITPSGWTLVVWSTVDDEVHGAWRPPGGRFGREIRFASGRIDPHQLVATSDGKVAMVWQTAGRQNDGVAHVMLLDEGAASGPTEVIAGPGVNPTSWAVADARGHAVVVVPGGEMLVAVTRSAGEAFGPPQQLDAGLSLYPVMASNAAGDIAIAYQGADLRERLVERPAGAARFGTPELVPVPPDMSPRVAVTDAGDVAISAEGTGPIGSPISTGTVLAVRPRGGQFTTQPLNDGGFSGDLLPASGNRLTVFDAVVGNALGSIIRTRDRTPTGGFTDPVAITPDNTCFLSPVVTASDDTIVTFGAPCTGDLEGTVIQLTERPAGGVFSPALPISPINSNLPEVAANPSGAIAIAWTNRPGAGTRRDVIQAVVRDGSAELGVLDKASGIVSTIAGTVDLVLGCTGLHDCRGSVQLVLPPGRSASTRAVAARSATANGRHRVVLARGTTRKLRLRLPPAALRHRRRAHLVIRMSRVRRAASTRTVTVELHR